MRNMRCGILAFQGDVAEHEQALARLGVPALRVTQDKQLDSLTHVIIPGGESTVIAAFLEETGMGQHIQERVRERTLSIFGTCAGAIVIAQRVISPRHIEPLNLIDVTILRNAFGAQIHSFEDAIFFGPTKETIIAVFIRAPKIQTVGERATILATLGGSPVLVQQENVLVSTFHPEYLTIPVVHKYFLEM